ncbi:MAG: alpha/beta hydrolase [Bacteroidetes bacterium]|nr:alpha/beta hydrolase [Bacteroidota bacterium]
MKKAITFFISGLVCLAAFAQSGNWKGLWRGELDANGSLLEMYFRMDNPSKQWVCRMDVPAQSARNLPGYVETKGKEIQVEFSKLDAVFKGKRTDTNHIKGLFTQNGSSYPLQLTRVWFDPYGPKPQTPKPPFAYTNEELRFSDPGGRVRFAATLTRPDTQSIYPVVILISGSGNQNRDEQIGNHRPFAVLADALTKAGYAVFRADDRGAGSTLCHPDDIQVNTPRLADDVAFFINFLKKQKHIDSTRFFLLGHSEGGIIAPMVAANRNEVRGLILLAPPLSGGRACNLYQNEIALKQQGISNRDIPLYMSLHTALLDSAIAISSDSAFCKTIPDIVSRWKATGAKHRKTKLLEKQGTVNPDAICNQYLAFHTEWWKFMLSYNPAADLKKLNCPVLALFGEKDKQVEAKSNTEAFTSVSLPKPSAHIVFPGLNHLMQRCSRCTVDEYFLLEETLNPKVTEAIIQWMGQIK